MRQADGMFDLSGRLLGASLSLERLWEVMLNLAHVGCAFTCAYRLIWECRFKEQVDDG